MDAKLKAKELVEKFVDAIWRSDNTLNKPMIKTCAIICVDEILTITNLNDENQYVNSPNYRNYWIDVKTEIEKL